MHDFPLWQSSKALIDCLCSFEPNSSSDIESTWDSLLDCSLPFAKHFAKLERERFVTLHIVPQIGFTAFDKRCEGDPLRILLDLVGSIQGELEDFCDIMAPNVDDNKTREYRDSHGYPISKEEFVVERCRYWTVASLDFRVSQDAWYLIRNLEIQCGAIYSEVRRSEKVGYHHPAENPITTESETRETSRPSVESRASGRPSKDGTEEILTKWDELVASNDPRTEGLYGSRHLHRVLSRWLKLYFNHDRTPSSVMQSIRSHVNKLEPNQSSTLKAVGNVDDNNPPKKLWGNFLSDPTAESSR